MNKRKILEGTAIAVSGAVFGLTGTAALYLEAQRDECVPKLIQEYEYIRENSAEAVEQKPIEIQENVENAVEYSTTDFKNNVVSNAEMVLSRMEEEIPTEESEEPEVVETSVVDNMAVVPMETTETTEEVTQPVVMEEVAVVVQPEIPAVIEEVIPQPEAPAVIEEVIPQPEAPEVVEEVVTQPEAPEVVEEVVTQPEAPEVVEEVVTQAEAPEVVEEVVTQPEAPEVVEEVVTQPEAPEVVEEVIPQPEEPQIPTENTGMEVENPEGYELTTNERIVESANSLVGVTDGMQCTEVVGLALEGAGLPNTVLWPDEYAGTIGYYTDTPEAGNLIYYDNGGRGLDHIAIYVGDDQAIHGNYLQEDGTIVTTQASIFIGAMEGVENPGQPQFIQVY